MQADLKIQYRISVTVTGNTLLKKNALASTGSSYRSIDSEDVEAGTGVTSGSASDVQSSDAATPGTDTASGGQAQ